MLTFISSAICRVSRPAPMSVKTSTSRSLKASTEESEFRLLSRWANSPVRVTDAYRKTGGKWLIVREHASVPVDLSPALEPTKVSSVSDDA